MGLILFQPNFDQLQLPALITKHLEERPPQAVFAEDISPNLKEELCKLKTFMYIQDTLLRLQKSLAIDKKIHIGKSSSANDLSKNAILNELNLDKLLLSKTLRPNRFYDIDFDHQFIPCEKYDSKKGYKMKQGYFPSVTSPGKEIVFIENKNVNRDLKFK